MELEKITEERQAAPKRRYDDACGTAHGLDLVGERWALLVLRELLLGPRRFSQLRADLPGISANVLAQRLAELESRGLVERRQLAPPASVQVYDATEWGREAEPIVAALGRWAARSPRHDPTLPISGVSMLLSMRTMIDPVRSAGLDARVALSFAADRYAVHVHDRRVDVRRGDWEEADLSIAADPPATLAAVLYGKAPLDTVQWHGDRALFERLVDCYHLPPKAPIPGH